MSIVAENIYVVAGGIIAKTITSLELSLNYPSQMACAAGTNGYLTVGGIPTSSLTIEKIYTLKDKYSQFIDDINNSSDGLEPIKSFHICYNTPDKFQYYFLGIVTETTLSAQAGELPSLSISVIGGGIQEVRNYLYSIEHTPIEEKNILAIDNIKTSVGGFNNTGYITSFDLSESKEAELLPLFASGIPSYDLHYKINSFVASKNIRQKLSLNFVLEKRDFVIENSFSYFKEIITDDSIFIYFEMTNASGVKIQDKKVINNCKLVSCSTVSTDSDLTIYRLEFEGSRRPTQY